MGDRRQPAFGVPHRRGRVAVDRSEIAVTVDQCLPQAERLRHPHQCVVDRLVAVRVIGLHHLADDGRALDIAAVGRDVQVVPHRVQDPALHGFEPVAQVRQCARRDHRKGVIQIARPRRLGEMARPRSARRNARRSRRESLSERPFLFAIALLSPRAGRVIRTIRPNTTKPGKPAADNASFSDTISAYTVNALLSSCNWVSARQAQTSSPSSLSTRDGHDLRQSNPATLSRNAAPSLLSPPKPDEGPPYEQLAEGRIRLTRSWPQAG